MKHLAELPDPEEVLALAYAIAESNDEDDNSPTVYGTHAAQVEALVKLASEIRAVKDWRKENPNG